MTATPMGGQSSSFGIGTAKFTLMQSVENIKSSREAASPQFERESKNEV